MIEIEFTQRFKKRFNKLPKKLQEQFYKRIDLFCEDPKNSLLKVHPLKGKLTGFRAFSVNADCRVVFQYIKVDLVKLVDIGTHNQVY